MQRLTAFLIIASVKTFSQIFYRGKFKWISPHPDNPFWKARLIVFLNHTSLYEPLFLQYLSYRYLWHLVAHVNVPGADVTLRRPIVGLFYKLMLPNIASVTRKKDLSWKRYLNSIQRDSIVIIAPEGRMKRPNGLDKYGHPMSVRGGIADIIEAIGEGGMILCFSGGLHHVQAPGQNLPRLFKTISMNFAYLDLKEYKQQFSGTSRERKIQLINDLQKRLQSNCPK